MSKIEELIKNGVIIKDIKNTYIDDSVEIGSGVTIFPNVSLRGKTKIGNNCVIDMGTIIEDSAVGANNKIGPNAHIHTNSAIGNNNIIGNFVEIKDSKIGDNNKIKHLTYCGNADIGNDCNIGCGVVFSNYNYSSTDKENIVLGDNVFVGGNAVLCGPLNISSNSVVGAGSVINEDVPEDSLAIARPRQTTKIDYFKEKKA